MVLSGAQAKAVQKNWANVKAHAQKYGNDLFVQYLTQNPGDIQIFAKFRDANLGDLRSNAEFNKQTKTVIDALSKIVDNLGDLNAGCSFLRERVRTHHPRGISMAQFERLLDLMPMFLQEQAGADGVVADAWRILVADLMPEMRDEFTKCSQ
ncbi:hypothetical protein CAPTEDRAFT_229341 [Capitella teleta]|uniref:Globin domain-containing protein n=1 Tax=Capitella teleta TaxID=283909 RepID=R7TQB2_CAPTE|nr:hypothetical protein CAPTEDRAFT_229341 [Capitella teleta]|eukprot:ELT93225.1 hypothetical protein CAPTEDRAFT_229341 [Capitella teleta]